MFLRQVSSMSDDKVPTFRCTRLYVSFPIHNGAVPPRSQRSTPNHSNHAYFRLATCVISTFRSGESVSTMHSDSRHSVVDSSTVVCSNRRPVYLVRRLLTLILRSTPTRRAGPATPAKGGVPECLSTKRLTMTRNTAFTKIQGTTRSSLCIGQ